jgi:predicted transposase/invertase (TIGR01784 family)
VEGEKEGIKKGREEGIKEGIEQGKRAIVLNAHHSALPVETISAITGLSQEEVQAIIQD